MQIILDIAVVFILVSSVYILIFKGHTRVRGKYPMSMFTFSALLFTAGLDSGLVMLPLTEFPVYATDPAFSFTNPAAIEFGFWGFLVWAFYFLTAYYFLKIEPKLKFFEIPIVNYVNNFVTITTCAFTAYLFLKNLPTYIDGISEVQSWLLLFAVVALAVFSSSEIRYIKVLSISATWIFFALIGGMWIASGLGVTGFTKNFALVMDYFPNIGHFILPIQDKDGVHAFYLLWWFSWSIMIGQFMAKFAGNMSTRTLMILMMIVPSIQLAIWFSVLYGYWSSATEISPFWKIAMVVVGTTHVVTTLDSLIRLYTDNMNWKTKRFGFIKYFAMNFSLMMVLVVLYLLTPLKIEWIGMIVIGLYVAVLIRMFIKRDVLSRSSLKSVGIISGQLDH